MLKAVYLTKEEIPSQYVELYSEKNGQWELTGVEGIKTEADIERITAAYGKRIKDAAKDVKGADELSAESIQTMIKDAIAEAGSAGGGDKNNGGGDDNTNTRLTNLERQLAAATEEGQQFKARAEKAEADAQTSILTAQLTAAVTAAGVRPEAVDHFVGSHKDDFELRDGKLARKFVESDPKTATESVDDYLLARKVDSKTAYFWPSNDGGGSGGSGSGGGEGGVNPWSKNTWNVTEQNKLYTADPKKATRLANAEGYDPVSNRKISGAA